MPKAKVYIKRLVLNGPKLPEASVDFEKGVNLIIGPSNTGKSLIIDCINYIFSWLPKKNDPRFRLNDMYGYDSITLVLETEKGNVILNRIVGDSSITVSGTDPDFKPGKYSANHKAKKNLNALLLQLIGIDEPHDILASQAGNTNVLTWRGFLHMFLIRQAYVSREGSVLMNPEAGVNSSTSSPAALLFLLTGKDAGAIEKGEDDKIKKAKKEAVMTYIRQNVDRLGKRQEELSKALGESPAGDLYQYISGIETELEKAQIAMAEAVSESKAFMDQIYALNSRIAECNTMHEEFSNLMSEYSTDLERDIFRLEGAEVLNALPDVHICPYCSSRIENPPISYLDDAKANLAHAKSHIGDLKTADADVIAKRNAFYQQVSNLEIKKAVVDRHIIEVLKPRIASLKQQIASYRRAVELRNELETLRKEQINYDAELFDRETEQETEKKKYFIADQFDYKIIRGFEDKLISILTNCSFPGAESARFSMEVYDVQFGSRKKSSTMGGGYCGIINTMVALSLMEYLLESGTYAPGMMLVDSPLSQFSESEYISDAETIKESFIHYLLYNKREGQIILVEQKDKMPEMIKSGAWSEDIAVKVIEFTKNKEHGRYGLLPGVYD